MCPYREKKNTMHFGTDFEIFTINLLIVKIETSEDLSQGETRMSGEMYSVIL
jgi:hypothetical protein